MYRKNITSIDQGSIDYRWFTYVRLSVLNFLIFTIPTLILINLSPLLDFGTSLFLVGIIFILSAPTAGFFSWMVVIGSAGANAEMALKIMGALPGGIYGLILGGFLGSLVGGKAISIILSIIFFFLGQYLGLLIGIKIGKRTIFLDTP